MNKLWSDRAWDDYLYWQGQDRRTLRKINDLVKDIERNGAAQDWQARTAAIPGWLEPPNRRKNRLVYDIDTNGNLLIAACRGHYED